MNWNVQIRIDVESTIRSWSVSPAVLRRVLTQLQSELEAWDNDQFGQLVVAPVRIFEHRIKAEDPDTGTKYLFLFAFWNSSSSPDQVREVIRADFLA